MTKAAHEAGSPTAAVQRRQAHKSHARLVELVESGAADEAEGHWRRHLEAISEYLLRSSSPKAVVELFG